MYYHNSKNYRKDKKFNEKQQNRLCPVTKMLKQKSIPTMNDFAVVFSYKCPLFFLILISKELTLLVLIYLKQYFQTCGTRLDGKEGRKGRALQITSKPRER